MGELKCVEREGEFGTGLLVGLKHQTLKEQKWGLVVRRKEEDKF